MNYATGYALNTNELFTNFPTEKLKMTTKECEKLIGNRHKEYLAKQVFKACVGLVLDDIIENSVTFQLPTRSKKAEMYMKRYSDDQFIECRQNGKFNDVQFLNSDFSGHQIEYKYQIAGVMKNKPIYLDSKHKNKITEYTNQGKSYY